MMRLVFLFSAEERGLLLLGDPLYDQNYALSTIREARTELRELKDFDRAKDHRDRAIRELNRAEEQVEKALKFAR